MSLTLWVRPEPFDYGAIHAPLPPKLNLHNLNKLAIYSRNKGKAGYPRLSYAVWRHIACNKLLLSEDQAWMYFETFDMLCDSSFKDPFCWYKKFSECKTLAEKDQLKNQSSVRTLQFILFLHIQHVHKISFRESLFSGEEWPTRTRSPDLENKGSLAVKSLDEHDHMMFVLHHLNEILELLMEPESGGSGAGSESFLTMEALDALGFLITGYDGGKTVQPLHELARLHSETAKSGFSKISRTFSFRQLQSWLRSNLHVSPFGVSAILSQGIRSRLQEEETKPAYSILSLSDSFDEHGLLKIRDEMSTVNKEINPNKSRIMSNANLAPTELRVVVLSQVCKQTVAKASEIYYGSVVKIHRSHYSYLYILCPLKAVTIENCHNSTIVLGPVKTAVNVIGCENVTFITICNRIYMSACNNCTFHLCTPTRPVVLGGNSDLTMAPYNTYYPKLEDHLRSVSGVTTEVNEWNNPLLLGTDHSEILDPEPHTIYRELPPDHFFTFTVPFSMKGQTDSPPVPLPSRYEDALQKRENAINSWYQMVKTSSLSKTQRQQLQTVVQTRFQEWLTETGNLSQLNGLVPPMTNNKGSPEPARRSR